jgi:LPXTG-site transpeptidase (sortase) family protein
MMKKWVLSILFIIVIVISTNSSQLYRSNNDHLTESNKSVAKRNDPKMKAATRTIIKKQSTNGIVPVRLYIPSIDLHASVEPVGVSNGRMEVPRSNDTVGYLSTGVLPGSVGNAVMDGHVDHYKGPAVFFGLRKLKTGDTIVVKNEKGYAITFVVDSVKSYKTAEAPLNEIFGPANQPRLNLITCTGKYSRKKREHEARLVIFTKRISEI